MLQCNPSLVFGLVVHYLNSFAALNTSNLRVRNFMTGAAREECLLTKAYFFVDARDIALCHVLASEKKEAAGKRFLIVADKFCNKQIAEIIGEMFPLLRDRLPTGEALETSDFPATGMPDFDNSGSVEVLGGNIGCSRKASWIPSRACRLWKRVDGKLRLLTLLWLGLHKLLFSSWQLISLLTHTRPST